MDLTCARCGYEATTKGNYVRHLHMKNPCSTTLSDVSREVLLKATQRERKGDVIECPWCEKVVSKAHLARHRKVCRSRPTVPTNTEPKPDVECKTMVPNIPDEALQALKETIKRELLNELARGSKSVTNNTFIINQNNVQNNIQQSIQVNNFGSENTGYLTSEFLSYCLLNPRKGMTSLIENIHYNKEYPENQNIRCKSLKQNVFEKYVDSEWRACDASNTLDELIKKGYRILNAHYADTFMNDPTITEDEMKQRAYERFRFLSDTSCTDYFAVKRELRLLIKDRTMYVLESPAT